MTDHPEIDSFATEAETLTDMHKRLEGWRRLPNADCQETVARVQQDIRHAATLLREYLASVSS
jgi:hypothetical protein